MRLNVKTALTGLGLLLIGVGPVYALNLGNLNITSPSGQPFKANITVQMTDAEFKSLGGLSVNEGDVATYQKLGIKLNSNRSPFELKLLKNEFGKPIQIEVKSSSNLDLSQQVFNDLLVELKWSSGLIRRIYTVLDDNSKNIQIAEGENLGQLTAKLKPEMGGASFDQTMIALYRANPQAFASGNINRLKINETLHMPSPDMAKSIPVSESKSLVRAAYKDYVSGNLDHSTDAIAVTVDEALGNISSSKEIEEQDRLKVGSSVGDAGQAEKAKQIEELVAQEKQLADAKLKIAELEKNITQLKHLVNKNSPEASLMDPQVKDLLLKIGLPLGFIFLTGLIFFGLFRKNHKLADVNSGEIFIKEANNLILADDDSANEWDEEELGPLKAPSSANIVPQNAKSLFARIDLNLDSPIQTPFSKNVNTGFDSLLKASPKLIPSLSEQRVKLNLAKSYLKIEDLVTAKYVLLELVAIGESAEPEILQEAKTLLARVNS